MANPEVPVSASQSPDAKVEPQYPPCVKQLPSKICILYWDIDGTLTDKDKPDEALCGGILRTASRGTEHHFITGRDSEWVDEVFTQHLRDLAAAMNIDTASTFKNLKMHPELGILTVDPMSGFADIAEGLKHEDFANDGPSRRWIATFFYTSDQLKLFDEKAGKPRGKNIIRDANGVAYLAPVNELLENPNVKFPAFIWSDYKSHIGTAEVIRDSLKRVIASRQDQIPRVSSILDMIIQGTEYSNHMVISPVSTAINFVPVLNGIPLDKDWSTGRSIEETKRQLKRDGIDVSCQEIAAVSVSCGDGRADFRCSRPLMTDGSRLDLDFGFVGPPNQVPGDPDLLSNLVFVPKGDFGVPATTEFWKQIEPLCAPLASIKS